MKNNYKVSINIEKTIFIEEVFSKAEAIRKAIGFMQEILLPGIKPYSKIIAVKTNNIEEDSESQLCDDQIKNIQETSILLSDIFNKDELKLLIEDLNFYLGT